MTQERIFEEATRWHDALGRDDADWDGFTRWLEVDPHHRETYDAIALIDDDIAVHRPVLAAILPEVEAPRPARQWWAWGGGIGATAAAAAAALLLIPAQAPDQLYRSAPGQARTIGLPDGSSVQLASSSMLRVHGDGTELTLDGTASFDVQHRPGRILTVQAGDLSIRDIGTRFEVSTGNGTARVAVAEGVVSVSASQLGAPVRLVAGRKLTFDPARDIAETSPIGAFASWREGRLVYDNAPLALVAAEIGRYSGQHIALDRSVADRRFSGVLKIGDGSGLVGDLARLMDMDVRGQGASVRLVGRTGDR